MHQMLADLWPYIGSFAVFMLGLAAQVSGYTNLRVALALFAISVALLFIPLWDYDPGLAKLVMATIAVVIATFAWRHRNRLPWTIRIESRSPKQASATPNSTVTRVRESPRHLTPYEIDQKLSKIDGLLEFIRGSQVATAESRGNEIRLNPWGVTKMGASSALIERCADYRSDVDYLTNKIEQIRSTDAHHPDIIAVLPSLNDMSEFANAISLYARAIEAMAKYDLAEVHFTILLEPRDLELKDRIVKFARWRGDATNKLMQLRKNVSP